jgi:dTDP-4-dehydrorhamnose reductase
VTLLILGAGGQVGQALGMRAGAAARGLAHAACDITDRAAVAQALSAPGLSAVVNCAGYTAVDRAESEPERAFAVNAEGAGIVARAAAERGLPLVHLSTDYVYAGIGTAAYREEQPIAPVNVYGASKAAGDAAVAAADAAHLILRVSWVFGVHGANFVKTMLRLGRERSELRVVDDQNGGPTAAGDIAGAIMVMADRCRQPGFSAWGTYHFAGRPSTSWYGFARAIFARAAKPAPRLVPISSRDYPTPAARPRNSLLECSRIRRVFGIERPDWRRSLSRVMADLGERT